jgi:hypothetical protein
MLKGTSMDAQTVLNAKTAQLCQQLGAIEAQLQRLQVQKAATLAQLDALDSVAPAIKNAEAQKAVKSHE